MFYSDILLLSNFSQKYMTPAVNFSTDTGIEISRQLVHVAAKGSTAELRCYTKDGNDVWQLNESLGILDGYAGRNGLSASKKEGDGCTPAGFFRFGDAFGNCDKPETRMPFRKVTPDSLWVDDTGSMWYNTWVEGHDGKDLTSAERLADYPREYAYGVVIEYNTSDRIPGKGSAIFLHCGDKPTSGCIAIPENELLKLLKWLDPAKTPGILITNAAH